ncbi:MAG: protoporphyrinogen oxidase HemJ [Proteobacteria bacterium]|jgi:putative membrane protein|nr:protoporphyrinogen oxidase HemJ [Pseudomonadota bacterium]MDB4825866.1 protoporphyrinogen oxidase HemJ [Gammaproteobacteria bacterium]MBT4108211.1 protoporphyrinogen oxidase HemJ [Pseudomonadota bacterium]MBT4358242.1 protoporphyrinogen oxidase HemJ [Pseudomonadota bacterium]MBT4987683.1 protoporphyrinogen oxidase HemJ [Pseudomonadota bacterium]|tara:strand:+ start:397 stop:822 length:426 start_codon:yes stop_codon:yes gene_type:complete
MPVLWLKALHIIFMVTWFAGLFYLPRLFVYHAMTEDEATRAQFRIMERKLYYGIMNPGGVLTVLFGIWLWLGYGIGDHSLWLQLKIGLVLVLIGYHFWCGRLVKRFQEEANVHSHIFYRWFNEFPVLILVGAVLLVVLKPV